jgi:hypothetical protein
MRTYVWSVLALLALADVRPEQGPAPDARSIALCQVTSPNGVPARGEQPSLFIHGNNALSVVLDWPDGTVTFRPGGPGFVLADGSLSMKFPCAGACLVNWPLSVTGWTPPRRPCKPAFRPDTETSASRQPRSCFPDPDAGK